MFIIMVAIKAILVSALLWSSTAHEDVIIQTKQEHKNRCTLLQYSTTCLKLDILRLMAHLGQKTKLNLVPGVFLFSTERTKSFVNEIHSSTSFINEENVDKFLQESIVKYLRSLNVTVQLDKTDLLPEISFGQEDIWSGRKRRGLYTLATLAAIGFAILAAVTGKALTASMLALLLSALSAFRGVGAAAHPNSDHQSSPPAAYGKVTQYDIITRPVYQSAPVMLNQEHDHYNSYVDTYTSSGRDFKLMKITDTKRKKINL